MLKVLTYILCDLDPKVKVKGQKAGICDGVPLTSALVYIFFSVLFLFLLVMQIDKLHANIFQQQKLKNVSAAYVLV